MGVAGQPVQVRNHDAAGSVTQDGPFMSSTLPVAGFAVIDAASLAEARVLADSQTMTLPDHPHMRGTSQASERHAQRAFGGNARLRGRGLFSEYVHQPGVFSGLLLWAVGTAARCRPGLR